MTTIVDLDTGQILGVVDGRDQTGVGARTARRYRNSDFKSVTSRFNRQVVLEPFTARGFHLLQMLARLQLSRLPISLLRLPRSGEATVVLSRPLSAEGPRPRLVDVGQTQDQRDIFEHAGAEPVPDCSVVVVQKLTNEFDLPGVARAHSLCHERLISCATGLHEESHDVPVLDQSAVGGLDRAHDRLRLPGRTDFFGSSGQSIREQLGHVEDGTGEQRLLTGEEAVNVGLRYSGPYGDLAGRGAVVTLARETGHSSVQYDLTTLIAPYAGAGGRHVSHSLIAEWGGTAR